VFALIGPAV